MILIFFLSRYIRKNIETSTAGLLSFSPFLSLQAEKLHFLFHLKLEMAFLCHYLSLAGCNEYKIHRPPVVLTFQHSSISKEVRCCHVHIATVLKIILKYYCQGFDSTPFYLVHIGCESTNT